MQRIWALPALGAVVLIIGGVGRVRAGGRRMSAGVHRGRERQAGHAAERVGHRRRGEPGTPGLRDRHQRQRRLDGRLQGRHARRAAIASTSTAWAGTAATGRARSRPIADLAGCAQPAGVRRPTATRASSTAATGTTSASWTGPAPARSRASTSRTSSATARRREPHRLRRPRRRRPLRRAVPDLRHDVAGLQPVRRQQPLHGRSRQRSEPGVQGQLQPAVHDPRARRPRTAVFNAEYPMIRWLERNGYDVSYTTGVDTDRRGAADPQPPRVPVGRPRRVLVGRAARERRGGARRRGEPRVLQRQRGLLEDPLGGRPPDAGLLQGDAQQRQDRSRPACGRARGATRGPSTRRADVPRTR